MTMLRVGVAGCAGRMGMALMSGISAAPDLQLSGGSVRPGSGLQASALMLRQGLGEVLMMDDIHALAQRSDAIIDFTNASYSLQVSDACARAQVAHICGTTGFSEVQKQRLQDSAAQVPVVWAPNMSIGVTLFTSLVEQAAHVLNDDYDVEIFEMHHQHKKDAPSGTALSLGRAAAAGRSIELDEKAFFDRTGARERGSIGFASLRGGDVVGDHSVIFAGPGERFELTHRASSREIYVRGALLAVRWAHKKAPGFYSMRDVVGI
ncbi:MAG: 4-hydroxy-tetrahydrodipicolinate reductase [Rickettsiales bacterium]|nr:4-hydroxy-tetrahydrodipicolinate reductase [Rickettsiales bacterium]